jgi:hypothetical protein
VGCVVVLCFATTGVLNPTSPTYVIVGLVAVGSGPLAPLERTEGKRPRQSLPVSLATIDTEWDAGSR